MQYAPNSHFTVTLPEGTRCRSAGLQVEYAGAQARVFCETAAQTETFWACRLAHLRANPNAD